MDTSSNNNNQQQQPTTTTTTNQQQINTTTTTTTKRHHHHQRRRRRDMRTLPQSYISALIGEVVEVELRDNRVVTGILDIIDKDMNIIMGKCKGIYVEGPRKGEVTLTAELAYLQGVRIRYIRLPTTTDTSVKRAWEMNQREMNKRQWIS
jgi:small nuclear ribonucleoprotein (snRNP)-like protein